MYIAYLFFIVILGLDTYLSFNLSFNYQITYNNPFYPYNTYLLSIVY